ncbi:efflux RND transporter periplasmic adaptor subunit [Pectobacterium carotovorum]|uniref:Macrolide-specific efflux protein MacA n=2 Tax=Pectobacterium carotovorum TaxID=554 RepID=A0AAI9PCK8_PECCC|nr:efflux RND transporter periplasmic adaptor subunit [Pectobacterium carotovorum]GKX49195.1 macrolide-specific efflux protein MacA [Pectobacterium carotovorum subsp. carotovorum]GLV68509.1 macrolide-specific efflux protein MacA [Pectobacterium carotovorum subsp. carotovorum]
MMKWTASFSLIKKPYYLLLLFLISALAIYIFNNTRKDTHDYKLITVKQGDLQESISALALIVPSKLVNIGTQVTGQVKKIHVNVGDIVDKNTLIAEINATSQENELTASQARLESLQAQLHAKIATSNLDAVNFQRQKKMLHKNLTSILEFEEAEVTLKVSRAEIKSLEAQVQEARILVDTARINLGYTRITSPISGTVVAILANEGQTLNANQTTPNLVKVANLSTMSIVAKISEADISKVKIGQKATFSTLGARNEIYTTSVKNIEPAPININQSDDISEPTQGGIYYRATMDIDNRENQFRALMTTQINIISSEAKNTLLIPSVLLKKRNSDGSYSIDILDSHGNPSPRNIKIGMNNRVMAQVLEGLTSDDKIITNMP